MKWVRRLRRVRRVMTEQKVQTVHEQAILWIWDVLFV